ncbi:hypothetical protein [Kribbella sp. DT2]|uniref:hypothetical protein n=1 Tax=Kribbella sp. DT2 TaxID=3393427 RepID=UPI003CE9EFF9
MSTTTATKKATSTRKAAPAKPASTKPAPRGKAPAKRAASKPTVLAAAAATGKVKFYRQRANKTLRNLPYFAPGTDTRKAAEAVQKRRESGDTIGAIAEDLNASVATVRRMITGLLLAQAVEAGEHDKAWDGTEGAEIIVNGASK